jgi:predicted NAD-dependent protein-ADP-ribosyltransferase YbiA (DUF1768 family)
MIINQLIKIDMSKSDNANLVLGREEVYKASPRIWSFKYTYDIVDGMNLNLSNMVSAYPFECGGYLWKDSERLYLCGEFSENTESHNEIQQRLVKSVSGYAAKRFVKSPNKRFVRSDFAEYRLQWMLYVVWQKCKGNADFRKLLMRVPEDVTLVENTTTDKGGTAEAWGCRNRELVDYRESLAAEIKKANPTMKKKDLEHLINVETNKVNSIGEWRGQNSIGKILMICRDCIINGTEPVMDYDLLRNAHIHIFGKLLQFN